MASPSQIATFPATEILQFQLASSEKMVVQNASDLHPYVADQLEGRTLDGQGVHMALVLALHEYRDEKRPSALFVELLKKDVMHLVVDTVVEDEQVAAAAKDSITRIGF